MNRLPVNPRRHKIPTEARKRVAQACNSCNVRRAKCSGGHPCERCRKASRDCIYPVVAEVVTLPKREIESLNARCALLERALAEAIPSERERMRVLQYLQTNEARTDLDQHDVDQDIAEDGQTVREGRILQDPDGTIRYLGESSGATFLNHLREYMATVFPLTFEAAWSEASNPDTAFISALGKYQTHDSRPLLISNVDPHHRPTQEQAISMLTELRHSAQDGDGTFASGGIYYWVDPEDVLAEYKVPNEARGLDSNNNGSSMATANAAFAVACLFDPSCAPQWESGFGQTFFARARALIGNPLDVSLVSDASVLALLSFYLLNNNRRDAAYIYVSVAMHILIVHGVHRAWMVDEKGKRLFWTIYVLDRWLSCLMGRPALISDEAIKLDLPRDSTGLPPSAGLRAHIELARISNYIVANVYDISRSQEEPFRTTLCIQRAMGKLRSWEDNLSPLVRCTEENLAGDRGVGELHMAQNQLFILAIRPLLFIAVKKVTADMILNGKMADDSVPYRHELDLCADAARRNAHLWHALSHLPRPARLSHTSIHYLFNAALTLQLYQILAFGQPNGPVNEVTNVIAILRTDLSSNREYSTDCANVLVDLSSLMERLSRIDLSKASQRSTTSVAVGHGSSTSPSILATPNVGEENSNRQDIQHGFGGSQHGMDNGTAGLVAELNPFGKESTYNALLSWLDTDDLQQRFDFPHRTI